MDARSSIVPIDIQEENTLKNLFHSSILGDIYGVTRNDNSKCSQRISKNKRTICVRWTPEFEFVRVLENVCEYKKILKQLNL